MNGYTFHVTSNDIRRIKGYDISTSYLIQVYLLGTKAFFYKNVNHSGGAYSIN